MYFGEDANDFEQKNLHELNQIQNHFSIGEPASNENPDSPVNKIIKKYGMKKKLGEKLEILEKTLKNPAPHHTRDEFKPRLKIEVIFREDIFIGLNN